MHETAIVTDSTAVLPEETLTQGGIASVSLYVQFPDGSVLPEVELDLGEFYERLLAEDELPTTSPPTVEDFISAYEPLLREGKDVVSIHISSGISETCNVARQAAARLAEIDSGRVEVVDSAATAAVLALLVHSAAAAAAAGKDADAIVRHVREARQTVRNRLVVDTLEFLRRGGRVGGAAAWLGSRLQVKPILALEAEVKAVERVRTMDRALDRLVEFAHALQASGARAWGVNYARNREVTERFVDRCENVFRSPPVFVSEASPVLGVHVGPGFLLIAGMDPAFLS